MTAARVLEEVTAPATEQQRDRARSAAEQLAEPSSVMIVRQPDGTEYAVPHEVQRALLAVLTAGAAGHSILVIGKDAQISPQKAAEWLGVSRPFVYRLIERGDLPAHRVGSHYRLDIADVLALVDRRAQLAASVDTGLATLHATPVEGDGSTDAKSAWSTADDERRAEALDRVRGRARQRSRPTSP